MQALFLVYRRFSFGSAVPRRGGRWPPQRTENREQRTENREQRTENREQNARQARDGESAGRMWKVLRKTQRTPRTTKAHKDCQNGACRCFFASLERPSVVHRLKPIRGRLPPADCQDGLHCASTHKGTKVRKGYKAFHDSPFGCSVARQGALFSVFRSPFS